MGRGNVDGQDARLSNETMEASGREGAEPAAGGVGVSEPESAAVGALGIGRRKEHGVEGATHARGGRPA
eukprot:8123356-Lingulodinium_polyedra.AAC.1